MRKKTEATQQRKIVSSRHLASEEDWQLSEFEYGLILAFNAFSRWITHCANAAEGGELGQLDILVLHNINHRNREKRLADICFMLNIEDTHTVNYSIRKLQNMKLITSTKVGKEKLYKTTAAGVKLCKLYSEIRKKCLLSGYDTLQKDPNTASEVATFLRAMSGIYDQASRSASSL